MNPLRRSEQSGGEAANAAQVAGLRLTTDFVQTRDPVRVRLIVNADDLGITSFQ